MNENIRVFDAFYNGFRAFRENLKALNPLFVNLSVRGAEVSPFVQKASERADRIAWNPGESRPKSCRSIRKGRQNRLESVER